MSSRFFAIKRLVLRHVHVVDVSVMTWRRRQVVNLFRSTVYVLLATVSCNSAHRMTDITEEYTVWPKDNASSLLEDYPWPSCAKTTGSQCPGLIDYLEHFCTPEDNQGCQKRNDSVSERHVLLNLLPGQHKMDLRENFYFNFALKPIEDLEEEMAGLRPGNFLFCWVSITVRGTKLFKTVIEITNHSIHQYVPQNSSDDKPCELRLKGGLQGALWSAFGFLGGGGVRFQDILLETRAANPPPQLYTNLDYHTQQAVITTWDIPFFEVERCRFPEIMPMQAAVVALYSNDAAKFSLWLKDCDFQSHFSSNGPWPGSSFPFVSIAHRWMDELSFEYEPSGPILSEATSEILLERCRFLSRCMEFPGLGASPRYVPRVFLFCCFQV